MCNFEKLGLCSCEGKEGIDGLEEVDSFQELISMKGIELSRVKLGILWGVQVLMIYCSRNVP